MSNINSKEKGKCNSGNNERNNHLQFSRIWKN